MNSSSTVTRAPAFYCRNGRRCAGFTLTEMAVVLVIVSLLMGYFLVGGVAFMETQNIKKTEAKLSTIEVALAGYVAINGRLPCPANGQITTGTEDGGVGGCTANQQYGVVPWITLGLSENDVLDAWHRRISYRVGKDLWVARGMDMTACDAAGTESVAATPKLCTLGCTSTNLSTCTPPPLFLQTGKGIDIKSAASAGLPLMDTTTTPSGGAAYVLISHGKNGNGGYLKGGGAIIPITGSGNDEAPNSNNVAVAFGTTFFVDRDYSEAEGPTRFDDIVLRPSIMRVLLQAQRGPRTH